MCLTASCHWVTQPTTNHWVTHPTTNYDNNFTDCPSAWSTAQLLKWERNKILIIFLYLKLLLSAKLLSANPKFTNWMMSIFFGQMFESRYHV